ncbi:hypothetical protein [Pacificibacter marinus]|uniref:hypothetical protein n=1 Tax=Pacificibacter marinus TaxID=658057 RepID=UPI0011137FA5|nr:hypothetical protein [Pacificibacter marinus]
MSKATDTELDRKAAEGTTNRLNPQPAEEMERRKTKQPPYGAPRMKTVSNPTTQEKQAREADKASKEQALAHKKNPKPTMRPGKKAAAPNSRRNSKSAENAPTTPASELTPDNAMQAKQRTAAKQINASAGDETPTKVKDHAKNSAAKQTTSDA